MSEGVDRVLARIEQIQSLLGDREATNEGFGAELDRSRRAAAGAATVADDLARSELPGVPESDGDGAPASLAPLIEEAAGRTGLAPELITAVMATESGFRPDAVSPSGALGLMQLMPGTAEALGVENPGDPRQNILGGAEYLRQQLGRFGTIEKALAAYNAGPGAVERYGGVPPFSETENYVRRVLGKLRRLNREHE